MTRPGVGLSLNTIILEWRLFLTMYTMYSICTCIKCRHSIMYMYATHIDSHLCTAAMNVELNGVGNRVLGYRSV